MKVNGELRELFDRRFGKVRVDEAIGRLENRQSLPLAFLGGIAGAGLSIPLWKLAGCLGDPYIGLTAPVAGTLVGLSVRNLGKGDGIAFSIVGVALFLLLSTLMFLYLGFGCGYVFGGILLVEEPLIGETVPLSVAGGAMLAWMLSRSRMGGDRLLEELRKL